MIKAAVNKGFELLKLIFGVNSQNFILPLLGNSVDTED